MCTSQPPVIEWDQRKSSLWFHTRDMTEIVPSDACFSHSRCLMLNYPQTRRAQNCSFPGYVAGSEYSERPQRITRGMICRCSTIWKVIGSQPNLAWFALPEWFNALSVGIWRLRSRHMVCYLWPLELNLSSTVLKGFNSHSHQQEFEDSECSREAPGTLLEEILKGQREMWPWGSKYLFCRPLERKSFHLLPLSFHFKPHMIFPDYSVFTHSQIKTFWYSRLF